MANRAKTISSKIANKIRELRQNAGLTQKELAERMYKSESAIRMWELGKSEPDLLSINALAEIFNVSADVILGNDTVQDTSELSDLKREIHAAIDEMPDDVLEHFLQMAKIYRDSHKKD